MRNSVVSIAVLRWICRRQTRRTKKRGRKSDRTPGPTMENAPQAYEAAEKDIATAEEDLQGAVRGLAAAGYSVG